MKRNKPLKRVGFKNKPRKPLKRTRLSKESKSSLSVLQRKLWEAVRGSVRAKYGNTCYTCDKTGLEGKNWHTGHLWAKASLGAYLKYDERVLRPQCYFCNINCGGQGAIFYKKMLKEIGAKEMGKLEQDRNKIVNARDHYEKLIKEYE